MTKIALIGTYQPRQCGIGSFSKNLFDSCTAGPYANSSFVVAINDPGNVYDYPPEVRFAIDQDDQDTYLKAAEFINHSGADVCLIQHEYGLFGGQNGSYILSLLHRLRIPVVATLHTVLKTPSSTELFIVREIAKLSQRIVVMAHKAVELLRDNYNICPSKIAVIPHGVPDLRYEREATRRELGLTNSNVLLTFGFVGRNKGIETVISALPALVARYPETVYIVLGKTHPNVVKHTGEEYRFSLQQLVKKLNLEKHVVFLNQYASQRDLLKYLSACDIYITPYLSEAQITSGTLTYALGVGSAVVSTPYWHAAELLADGRGALFDFGDSRQLSEIMIDLFSYPAKLATMRSQALRFGKAVTWPRIGLVYGKLLQQASQQASVNPSKKIPPFDQSVLPPFRLDHVTRLTDDTGIFQHAIYGIPNYHEGYCLDDNARALLMVLMAHRNGKGKTATRYIPRYLAYIQYAQNADGTFRNFMGFDRRFLDDIGSEDAFGRALWAVGYAIAYAPKDAYREVAHHIFFKSAPQFGQLRSIRSIAATILGVFHYLKCYPTDDRMTGMMHDLAYKLYTEYQSHRHKDWHWYESLLAYDNALLPLAMLRAAQLLKDESFRQVGFESLAFLEKHTMQKGHLTLVGNDGWFKRNGAIARFDQQPVDAMATILLFIQAYHDSREPHYLRSAYTAFMWFFGENDLRLSLYDPETGGCCDGLATDGINRNQGAESTLAYLISYLAVEQTFEKRTTRQIIPDADESSYVSTNRLADTAS